MAERLPRWPPVRAEMAERQLWHGPQADPDAWRRVGRDGLSLALIESRNHSLHWLTAWEQMLSRELPRPSPDDDVVPPLWLCGRIGWFQEAWIARNVQRLRGPLADPQAPRLASMQPEADHWFEQEPERRRGVLWTALDGPGLRHYLLQTLESTLEMLEATAELPDALYAYRIALVHEDLCGERLIRLAQTLGLGHPWLHELAWEGPRPAGTPALWFPATRWNLGLPASVGFRMDNEVEPHETKVPAFEIDAHPVTWAAYAEFVEDGGYDDPTWWSQAGRAWVERSGRRAPRHVEQVRGGVLVRRFGRALRAPAMAPAVHVNLHEAQAWCRWAGRRLPTEVEWDMAAQLGAHRGWRAGEVHEWTASRYQPYARFVAGPWRERSVEAFDAACQSVRGAAFITSARLRDPRFRRFARPEADHDFIGFRSCAI